MNKLVAATIALASILIATTLFGASVERGRTTYDQNCVMCHGDTGAGVMPDAPDFSRREGLFSSDSDLLKRILEGKYACPAYRGILTKREILDVIAYIRSF